MEILRFILIVCITTFASKLNGQVVIHFDYDNSGNRTGRQLTVNTVKSGSIEFPVKDSGDIPDTEIKEGQEKLEEIRPIIYPNPNNGILKIEGLSIPSGMEVNIWLYDLSGVAIISKNESRNAFDLNINHLADGLYILRIRIGEKLFDWKIIKRN
jgi:hypothetical protein